MEQLIALMYAWPTPDVKSAAGYFIAGAETDDRINQLNLWYHRIGGSDAASIGFVPVHFSKGDWHGY